jgi:hypothetical protein
VRHLAQEIVLQQALDHEEGRSRPSIDTLDVWEARLVDLSRARSFAKARHGRGPGFRPGVSRADLIAKVDALRSRP